jgi:hypothetical protein
LWCWGLKPDLTHSITKTHLLSLVNNNLINTNLRHSFWSHALAWWFLLLLMMCQTKLFSYFHCWLLTFPSCIMDSGSLKLILPNDKALDYHLWVPQK